jgi:DNA-binding CsgD family transcriptional regulator
MKHTSARAAGTRCPRCGYQPCPLSDREREVMEQVKLGRTNAAIARELSISLHTVKSHLAAVARVLDAPNRTAAVTAAMGKGWIA